MCSQTRTEAAELRVAAIQMVSGRDLTANLARAAELLDRAASEGAELAILPENFACFGLEMVDADERRRIGEEAAAFVADQARSRSLWVLGGSVPQGGEGERSYAASLLFAPDGRLQAQYNKLHLFDVQVDDEQGVYRESASYAPGGQVVCTEIAGASVGLSICYDLRFPELYRLLASQGAEVLLVPSAFTYRTGEAHWETLLRARAIENLCWVVAPNQGGRHDNGRQTWGHSMIVDPWGRVVAEAGEGEAVCSMTLDLRAVREYRAAMPVLQHARLKIQAP